MTPDVPFDPTRSDVTVLDLRAHDSQVHRRTPGRSPVVRAVALGVDTLVGHCLRHEPPWPVELEHAIERTEDVVMPLASGFGGSALLVLKGLGASLVAGPLHAPGDRSMVLEDVEAHFNRLVAVSQGRPASQEALPIDARFVAALLILREFMHHLNLGQVMLQPSKE